MSGHGVALLRFEAVSHFSCNLFGMISGRAGKSFSETLVVSVKPPIKNGIPKPLQQPDHSGWQNVLKRVFEGFVFQMKISPTSKRKTGGAGAIIILDIDLNRRLQQSDGNVGRVIRVMNVFR